MAGLKESQIIFKHRAMTPVQILEQTQFKNPVILKMLNNRRPRPVSFTSHKK